MRLLLLLLVAVAGGALIEQNKSPAIVIVCEIGGLYTNPDEARLADGYNCVLHDKNHVRSAASIAVYDNYGAP